MSVTFRLWCRGFRDLAQANQSETAFRYGHLSARCSRTARGYLLPRGRGLFGVAAMSRLNRTSG